MNLLIYAHYFAPSVGGVESSCNRSPMASPNCAH